MISTMFFKINSSKNYDKQNLYSESWDLRLDGLRGFFGVESDIPFLFGANRFILSH